MKKFFIEFYLDENGEINILNALIICVLGIAIYLFASNIKNVVNNVFDISIFDK